MPARRPLILDPTTGIAAELPTGDTVIGGGLNAWVLRSSNYTAVNGDRIMADTRGGAFTITLPANPQNGWQIDFDDAFGSWGTNNLTIGRNGQWLASYADDILCHVPNVSFSLVYSTAASGWVLVNMGLSNRTVFGWRVDATGNGGSLAVTIPPYTGSLNDLIVTEAGLRLGNNRLTLTNATTLTISASTNAAAIIVQLPGGPQGITGGNGTNGLGVPAGGSTNQVLAKTSGADNATAWTSTPTFTSVTDAAGNLRDIPINAQTTAYVVVATDNGKCIAQTTGGLTINNNVLTAGNSLAYYNDSASSQTISFGAGVTGRLAGTTTTGQRTVAARGLITIFARSASEIICSGAGLT